MLQYTLPPHAPSTKVTTSIPFHNQMRPLGIRALHGPAFMKELFTSNEKPSLRVGARDPRRGIRRKNMTKKSDDNNGRRHSRHQPAKRIKATPTA